MYVLLIYSSIGIAMSMSPTAVMSGLMINVSFMLAHSYVKVEGTQWMEPVILWECQKGVENPHSIFCDFFVRYEWSVTEKISIHQYSFEKMGALMANNDGRWVELLSDTN